MPVVPLSRAEVIHEVENLGAKEVLGVLWKAHMEKRRRMVALSERASKSLYSLSPQPAIVK